MLPQSLIYPTPKLPRSFLVGTTTKRRKETNHEKTKIGVETSVTVKVGEIDENIGDRKSIRMRKDLVVLYYLEQIASVLVFCKLS